MTLLNDRLPSLEQDLADQETIHAIFRSTHTLKGSAAMLKLKPIAETAHRLEQALSSLRDGKLSYSSPLADLLFPCVDVLGYR